MSDDNAGTLNAIGEFIKGLTPKSLLLGIIAAFVGVALYSIWENRVIVFLYIIKSPALLWGIGIALAFALFAWITLISVRRVEEMFETRITELDKQVSELRKDLEGCRLDCKELSSGMLKQILDNVKK